MAIPYSSGAVLAFANVPGAPGGSFVATFLGTGEVGPDIETENALGEVKNDLGGDMLCFDKILMGVNARVSINFTRWNEAPLGRLESLSSGFTRGTTGIADIGALLATEGRISDVWFVFAFGSGPSAKPIFTAAGMPAGYHFPLGFLDGPRRRPTGTRANSCAVTFGLVRQFSPSARTFVTFDHNMTAVASLPIN